MATTNQRMRQLIGTTAQWAANNLVIGDGEIAVERQVGNVIRMKVGDGVTTFSALPYVTALAAGYLALAGGTMTGPLVLSGSSSVGLEAISRQQSDSLYVKASQLTTTAAPSKVPFLDASGRLDPAMIVLPGQVLLKGSRAPTAVAPAAPAVGDMWIMDAAGTMNASYGAPVAGVAAAAGDQVIRTSSTTWGIVKTGSSGFLPLTGGTVTGPLIAGGGVTLGDDSADALTINSVNVSVPNGLLLTGGALQVTLPASSAIRVRSGAAGSFASLSIGRTASEVSISIAAAAGNFITGSQPGDLTINTNGSLLFGSGTTPGVAIGTTNNVGIGVLPHATIRLYVQQNAAAYAAKIENSNGADAGWGLWVDTRWNTAGNLVARFSTNTGADDVLLLYGDKRAYFGGRVSVAGETVAPWGGAARSLQISSSALAGYDDGITNQQAELLTNAYQSSLGTYNRIRASIALQYRQVTGLGHAWAAGATGAAGGAITWVEGMRLDVNGNLGLGAPSDPLVRARIQADNPTRGIVTMISNNGSSGLTGSMLQFSQNTIGNWTIGQPAAANAFVIVNGRTSAADGTEVMRIDSSGHVATGTDNAQTMGTASKRWSVVYAGTGTINTSDENEKTELGPIPEEWLDAWAGVQWQRFKYAEAVEAKGDAARWHVGLVAQQIEQVFADNGLDAFQCGLLCRDDLFDDEGAMIGQRYGIRYDEAQALEAAYVRRSLALH